MIDTSMAFKQSRDVIDIDLSKMKLADFTPCQVLINQEVQRTIEVFSGSALFRGVYSDVFKSYLDKPNVSNAKKLFKISAVEGLVSAYKLFYVGCSRAKKELDVIVDSTKIPNLADVQKMFEELGFEVVHHD